MVRHLLSQIAKRALKKLIKEIIKYNTSKETCFEIAHSLFVNLKNVILDV